MENRDPSLSWSSLFLITFAAVYLYIFNEWLFIVTKPSFLNDLNFAKQIQIYLTVSALLASVGFLGLLPLVISSLIPSIKRHTNVLIHFGGLLPAFIFSILILMMIDNFSYTVFKYGIVSTDGWSRGLYFLGFIALIVFFYQRTHKALDNFGQRTNIWGYSPRLIFVILIGVLLLSNSVLVFTGQYRGSSFSLASTEDAKQQPHILLITADGLDANHMSLYGYERETTPYMDKLAESALVAENAFSNSSKTTGSIISIYTSKYPTTTHVFSPPDILEGANSYEHLPGILRSQGYKTVQITVPYFLDPDKFNLLESFDEVKLRSTVVHSLYLNAISKVLPDDKALFVEETANRIVDRIRHIFFIEKMTNPYLLAQADIERWEILRQVILTTKQPIFVHIHLMVTHGKRFNPVIRKYSAGQSIMGQEYWSVDFYDDSILDFDKNIGEMVDFLMNLGVMDNTLVIVASDHGQQWVPIKRLPLVIRFPHGQYAGKIQANVQNLDIAPTILDYIGIEKPEWMRGESLLAGKLEQRPIFSESLSVEESTSKDVSDIDSDKPILSFDMVPTISLIYCNQWFMFDLVSFDWESGTVGGSTAVCPLTDQLHDEQAFQWIVEHLEQNGFDVSTLNHLYPWND